MDIDFGLDEIAEDEETLEEPDIRPEKAYIEVLEKCSIKEYGVNFKKNAKIELQLNPSDYSINTAVNFKPESAGINQEEGSFGSFMKEARPVLSVKFFFDSELNKKNSGALSAIKSMFSSKEKNPFEDMLGDIESKYLIKLRALTGISELEKRPPQVAFVYGEMRFRGFVSNLDIRYKEFNANGVVTRAEADVKITYAPDYLLSGQGASSAAGGLFGGALPSAESIMEDNPINGLDALTAALDMPDAVN